MRPSDLTFNGSVFDTQPIDYSFVLSFAKIPTKTAAIPISKSSLYKSTKQGDFQSYFCEISFHRPKSRAEGVIMFFAVTKFSRLFRRLVLHVLVTKHRFRFRAVAEFSFSIREYSFYGLSVFGLGLRSLFVLASEFFNLPSKLVTIAALSSRLRIAADFTLNSDSRI